MLGFMLMAFLIRLFMLRYEYVVTPDGVYYATLGKNLVSGNLREGLSTYWPPLYPLLVGLSSRIFQNLEFAGRLVSVLAGSLLVVPVYFLIRDSYGRDVATVGALLVTIYPSLTYYSTQLLTESTYTLFFIIGIVTGWSALSRAKSSTFLLTGLLFGCCYLIRPEAIGYIGLLIILTLTTNLFYHQRRFKRMLFNIFVLLLGFVFLSFPYILYLRQETGTWMISEKLGANYSTYRHDGKSKWWSLSEDGQGTLADRLYAGTRVGGDLSGTLQPVSTQMPTLSEIAVRSMKGLKQEYEVMIPKIFPPLFVLLTGIGLFRTQWSRKRTGKEIYLLLFVISTLIGYALIVPNTRYLVPLLPIFICWASKGIVEFESWLLESAEHIHRLKSIKYHKLLRPFIMTVVVLSLLPSMTSPMRGKWDRPLEPRHVAMWIKEHSDSSPLIMSTEPWAAFYSGGKHLYLPDEEYSVVIEYARHKKVDYIVVDDRWVPRLTPRLNLLLDEQGQHSELNLVYKYYDEVPHYKVLVYELADPSEFS